MHKPHLIDGFKYDLGVFVFLNGVNTLRIYVYRDGLASLVTEPYEKSSYKNTNNLFIHLTNYAINKNSLNFSKNYTAAADFVGSKRSLKFVMRYLRK